MSVSDRVRAGAWSLLLALVACSGSTEPGATRAYSSLTFALTGLGALDPAMEGTYAAWVNEGGQFRPLGTFDYAATVTLPLSQSLGDGAEIWISIQPPGDAGTTISAQKLLRGSLHGAAADLGV